MMRKSLLLIFLLSLLPLFTARGYGDISVSLTCEGGVITWAGKAGADLTGTWALLNMIEEDTGAEITKAFAYESTSGDGVARYVNAYPFTKDTSYFTIAGLFERDNHTIMDIPTGETFHLQCQPTKLFLPILGGYHE